MFLCLYSAATCFQNVEDSFIFTIVDNGDGKAMKMKGKSSLFTTSDVEAIKNDQGTELIDQLERNLLKRTTSNGFEIIILKRVMVIEIANKTTEEIEGNCSQTTRKRTTPNDSDEREISSKSIWNEWIPVETDASSQL